MRNKFSEQDCLGTRHSFILVDAMVIQAQIHREWLDLMDHALEKLKYVTGDLILENVRPYTFF